MIIRENKKAVLPLFAASAVVPIILSVLIFLIQKCTASEQIVLMTSDSYSSDYTSEYSLEIVRYEVLSDGTFTVSDVDPQIVFTNINGDVSDAVIKLKESCTQNVWVQVFYSDGSGFSEEKSVTGYISTGSNKLEIKIPKTLCTDIRFDIEGNFNPESIILNETVTFSAEKTLIIELAFLFVATVYAVWCYLPQRADKLNVYELFYWAGCCVYLFIWSCTKRFNYAPDEYLRYYVSEFIFRNDRLPVGTETTEYSIWGFSYSQMPTMLCNYLGYIPMKLTSLFTTDEYALMVAARFGSVLCGAICLLFLIKVAKLLFPRPFTWIVTVFVSMMPQYCFLCSYINNDICALCGVSMILYSWVRIVKEDWHSSLSVIMAIGIGICGISYYNSYGWPLMCILMLISYIVINKEDRKKLIKQGVIISGIVLVIMAFPFIRQYIVYGDFLGFETMSRYGEMYAVDWLKPSYRKPLTVQAQGLSVWYMFFDMGWIETVYKSFIGVFGYMQYTVSSVIITGYSVFFACMIVVLVFSIIVVLRHINTEKVKREYKKYVFYVCLVVAMIIPVVLSTIYSYTSDYQPQGKYIYSAFAGLAVFVGLAYSKLLGKINNKKLCNVIVCGLCLMLVTFNVQSFIETYLPT